MNEVKIIQLIPMPENGKYKGNLWGLGEDGITYQLNLDELRWEKLIPRANYVGAL